MGFDNVRWTLIGVGAIRSISMVPLAVRGLYLHSAVPFKEDSLSEMWNPGDLPRNAFWQANSRRLDSKELSRMWVGPR